MNTRILPFFCLILLVVYSCTKEKDPTRDYPRVSTDQVTNINTNGATFSGTFLQAGNSEIIDHGFVFSPGSTPSIHLGEKISLGTSTGSGSFTATANSGMKSGETYYVSAYAQNKDNIFYAEPIEFVSKGSTVP